MKGIAHKFSGGALIRDLTEGPVMSTLLRFSVPLMVSGVLQLAYNLADMIVVGQFVGKTGLSAVSNGGELLHLFTFIAIGFSNAGQIIISKNVGSGDREKLNSIIGTLFTSLLVCSVVLSAFGLCFHTDLLAWIGVPAEARSQADDYVIVCAAGLFFVYGYNCVSAVLRGMGDSRHPMLFISIASVLNVGLDVLFVGTFNMQSLGAALATIIGQGVSFICAFIILYKRKKEFYFDFKIKSFRVNKTAFSELLRLGIPMAIQSASINISKLFVTSHVNSYGVALSALSGIGNKLESIVGLVTHALSHGGATMISQSIGAGKYSRVPAVMRSVFFVAAVMAGIMAAVTIISPNAIFGIFTTDPDVLGITFMYVPVAIVLYVGCALRSTGMVMINGSGQPSINLAVAIIDGILIRIGLGYLLGITFGQGIYGFWYGNAIAGWMPLLIGLFFLFRGKWKK